MPDNPKAWLYKTAKNKAIDIIRRKKHSRTFDFSDPEKLLLTSEYTLNTTMENFWQENHIKNDFLGMMYACCHSSISSENQVTLILKSLCGFSTKEVAKRFLGLKLSLENTRSFRQFLVKMKLSPKRQLFLIAFTYYLMKATILLTLISL